MERENCTQDIHIYKIRYDSIEAPRIPIKMKDLYIEALADSGSGKNLIHLNTFLKIPQRMVNESQLPIRLVDVSNNTLDIFGSTILTLTFKGREITHEFIITKHISEDIIIGYDVMETTNL